MLSLDLLRVEIRTHDVVHLQSVVLLIQSLAVCDNEILPRIGDMSQVLLGC